MTFRRLLLVCALALGVCNVTPLVLGDGVAEAKSRKKKKKRVSKVKLCVSGESRGSGKKAKRRCSFVKGTT